MGSLVRERRPFLDDLAAYPPVRCIRHLDPFCGTSAPGEKSRHNPQEIAFTPVQLSFFIDPDVELRPHIGTEWGMLDVTIGIFGTPSTPEAHLEPGIPRLHHP